MLTLEQALATIIRLIEQARVAGDTRAVTALVQRKAAICAALCALEQS
jgi:hypothetical protein